MLFLCSCCQHSNNFMLIFGSASVGNSLLQVSEAKHTRFLQNAVLKTNYVGLLSVKTGQCLQEADSLTAKLWSPTSPFFLSFCFFLRWRQRFSCQSAYLAILFGFQPNANRQTDNINEGNGVGFLHWEVGGVPLRQRPEWNSATPFKTVPPSTNAENDRCSTL